MRFEKFERPRLLSARVLLCLALAAVSLAFLFYCMDGISGGEPDRISQMEMSISRLRSNNHSANLRIDALVRRYFHAGDEIDAAEGELTRAGYTVQNITEGHQRAIIAEKTVCRNFTLPPGFCDQIRIIFDVQGSNISNVEGFIFFQSL